MTADKYANLKTACDKAVADAKYWQEVCDETAALFDGVGSIFLPVLPKGRGPWLIYSESITELIRLYFEGDWHLNDYRQNGTELCLKQGYMTDHDFVSLKEMENIPYYRDLFFPLGLGICVGMTVETGNGTWGIAIQCKKDRPSLSEEEIGITFEVRKILQEATQAAEQQYLEKISSFLSLLGETNNAILVLDGDGEIVQVYDKMGLFSKISQVKLGAQFHHIIKVNLHREIKSFCKDSNDQCLPLNFIHNVGEQKVSSSLMQIPQSIRHYYSRSKVIVLTSLLTTPNSQTDIILSEIYGLTPSEITAVNLLVQGYRLKFIAENLKLSEGTIRQRFKNIYSKTGISTQAQLVSLLLRIEKA